MTGDHPLRARMVHVRTVPSAFHARVIAARLGADGILTELRGNVGGPYPIGETSVWVPAGEAEVAQALLRADEVEASVGAIPDGDETADGGADRRTPRATWARRAVAGAGLLAVAMGALAAHLGL
ncbi:MAG: hypothetical protein ACYDEN_08380 [Acidimicrobiales bacterium]